MELQEEYEHTEYELVAGEHIDINDVMKFPENYVVDIIALPASFSGLDDFYDSTVPIYNIEFPVSHYHACPHAAPSKFADFRKKDDEELGATIIYGRIAGTNMWDEVIDYFPSETWSTDEAREACRMRGGVAFVESSKQADDEDSFSLRIQKKGNEQQLVYGIVLEPNKVDLQGDVITPEEVEKAAHRYMEYMFNISPISMIGSEHERPITAVPVESFIAPVDFWYDGTPRTEEYKVPKGSWVLVAHIIDSDEFAKIKLGEYTGYSVQGRGMRIHAQ